MMHHNGREVDQRKSLPCRPLFPCGYARTRGIDFYDVPTERAAYAIFTCEGFDGDRWAAYYRTRDRVLRDGVPIPYPQRYWHAEVCTDGIPRKGRFRMGYLFSVSE